MGSYRRRLTVEVVATGLAANAAKTARRTTPSSLTIVPVALASAAAKVAFTGDESETENVSLPSRIRNRSRGGEQ